MTTANSSISWLQAFSLLPPLALNTMLQPVGRVLGSSAFNSVWLRASPIVCALDTLALILRLLAYCTFLHATLRQGLLIIGKDRFDELEPDYISRKAPVTTTLRLLGLFLSLLAPTYIVGRWGKIRWTMAWVWMYFASYIVLEIALQIARRELAKPQYTAKDFELESLGEADDDETSLAGSTEEVQEDELNNQVNSMKMKAQVELEESAGAKYTPGTTSSEVGSINDDIDGHTIHQMDFLESPSTEHLLGKTSDEGQRIQGDGDSTPAPVETAESENRTGSSDPEAAKEYSGSRYKDPFTSPRLASLKHFFNYCDVILLRWGCLLNAIFVYWAFLDLIQPPLHTYILSSTGWGIAIFFLKLPFIFAAMFFIMVASYSIAQGFLSGIAALARFVWRFLPTFIQERHASTPVLMVSIAVVGVGFYGAIFGAFFLIAPLMLGEFMQWLYSLLTVEAVVLLIFYSICFGLYLLLKIAAEITPDMRGRFQYSGYLGENGVVLVTCVIITFTVSILWYRFRFPSSAQWVQNWREALVYNTTMTI
ncbi:hypothetical protein N7510_006907 [Penicillium lagena]|uniref:uncharacterized protein n=1 Tax=Penicillium lagena TaxID=94218 RepID=UPI002540E509|nr:uncharacterized protein N7510_006907 [Penicillium lagena]KAJ5610188.1 hypothetical protein N7510_006907 [Penicillium lagena]